LREGLELGKVRSEEIEEIADGAVEETIGIVVEGNGKGLSGALKQRRQRVLKRRESAHCG